MRVLFKDGIHFSSFTPKDDQGNNIQSMDVSGSPVITSEVIQIDLDCIWAIQIVGDNNDKAGQLTIEHSLNGVDFVPIPYIDENGKLTTHTDDRDSLVYGETHFITPFLRFKLDFSLTLTGTVTAKFMTKPII